MALILALESASIDPDRAALSTDADVDLDGIHTLRKAHIISTFIIMPFIIILNILVLCTIFVFRRLHSTSNLFIASLAFNDFLSGLVFIPMYNFTIWEWDPRPIPLDTYWKCVPIFIPDLVTFIGSLINLTLLTVDRFMCIAFAYWYRVKITHNIIRNTICGIWFYLLLMYACVPLFWNSYSPGVCTFHKTLAPLFVEILVMGVVYSLTGLATILNVVLFFRIIFSMERFKTRWSINLGIWTDENWNERRQSVHLALFIYALFLLFHAPYLVSVPLFRHMVNDNGNTPPDITRFHTVAVFLLIANPLCNAILYTVLNENFRVGFKLLLTNPPWRWKELRDF